jgi:hypothetical protein
VLSLPIRPWVLTRVGTIEGPGGLPSTKSSSVFELLSRRAQSGVERARNLKIYERHQVNQDWPADLRAIHPAESNGVAACGEEHQP